MERHLEERSHMILQLVTTIRLLVARPTARSLCSPKLWSEIPLSIFPLALLALKVQPPTPASATHMFQSGCNHGLQKVSST